MSLELNVMKSSHSWAKRLVFIRFANCTLVNFCFFMSSQS